MMAYRAQSVLGIARLGDDDRFLDPLQVPIEVQSPLVQIT